MKLISTDCIYSTQSEKRHCIVQGKEHLETWFVSLDKSCLTFTVTSVTEELTINASLSACHHLLFLMWDDGGDTLLERIHVQKHLRGKWLIARKPYLPDR